MLKEFRDPYYRIEFRAMSHIPQPDKQLHRSVSLTSGLLGIGGDLSNYSRPLEVNRLQRKFSQNEFEVIVEESLPDTELESSQGRYSQSSGYRKDKRASFGPWQKIPADTSDSIAEGADEAPSEASTTPQPAEVKNAIKTLQNYQLNVVVDLKDILMSENDPQ